MYRIQSNLFGGFTLYLEDSKGLHKIGDYPSYEQAEAMRESLANNKQPEQVSLF